MRLTNWIALGVLFSPAHAWAQEVTAVVPAPVGAIMQTGLLGALLIVAGGWILRMHKENRDIYEARITDAKAVTEKVLTLVESQHATQEKLSSAIQENTHATTELKDWLQELAREMRRGGPAGL